MDYNDEMNSDHLDYLADVHNDFFDWLNVLWNMPEDGMPERWEDFVDEPSVEELREMDRLAEELLKEIINGNY